MKINACKKELQGGQFRPAKGGQLQRLLQIRDEFRKIYQRNT